MDGRKPNFCAGVVYVEFLIAIVPLLTFFLCLIQLALVLSAGIITVVGAQKAARAAIVVLSDDHEQARYAEPLQQVGTGASGIDAYRNAPSHSRYETIRMAARYPLASVSPSLKTLGADNVKDALSTGSMVDMALSLAGWTRLAVGLGFVNGNGEFISSFSPREMISAKVVFLFPCFIPLAKELVCKSYRQLSPDARELVEVNGKVIGWTRYAGWRFAALTGSASLPNQGRR